MSELFNITKVDCDLYCRAPKRRKNSIKGFKAKQELHLQLKILFLWVVVPGSDPVMPPKLHSLNVKKCNFIWAVRESYFGLTCALNTTYYIKIIVTFMIIKQDLNIIEISAAVLANSVDYCSRRPSGLRVCVYV